VKHLRTAHLGVGLLFLAVFVATGQYMDLGYDHLRGMADGPRLLYRSAHIYLLFAALLNLLLGSYLQAHAGRRARALQFTGSAMLLVAPMLLTLSFFMESQDTSFVRPMMRIAAYGTLVGGGLHFFSGFLAKATPALPKDAVLRVARPTDRLEELKRMYVDGLGFELLSEFHGYNGFDGAILGHPRHPYHLEFTHHRGTTVGGAPTKDNLLVFYVPGDEAWRQCCSALAAAGFKEVQAYNNYWDQRGKTFEDIDRYRVVIENDTWRK
jgi:hypothetical protein